MTVNEYKKLYIELLNIVDDCDGFNTGLFDEGEEPAQEVIDRFDANIARLISIHPEAFKGTPTEEEVEKCKYIAAMIGLLQDVPASKADWILNKYKGITEEELEEFIQNIE